MTEFKSRAVKSLVDLHEAELRSFLATWKRFKASGKPMPEARDDAAYVSAEHLVSHALGAARGYMMWIRDVLGSPVTDMELIRDVAVIVPQLDAYMEETLAGWRRHLAIVADEQLQDRQYKSRWGEMFDIEQMLEHAVVHPMRHRIQLERILAGGA